MFDAWRGYMLGETRGGAGHEGQRMTAARSKQPAAALSRGRCEDFLIHEARLLDDARFDEWLALFTDRGALLGAEPAEPAKPARHHLADV